MRHSRRAGARITISVRLVVLILASVISLAPLVYMILIALTANTFIITDPASVLKGAKGFGNFVQVWTQSNIGINFANSLIVACLTTFLVVLLSSMMAYAFARFEFPGKRFLFILILVELMIPTIMLIIPQFILTRDLHLLDSRGGLLLIYVGTNLAFNTFLLRGFFLGVPRELDDAMMVDGAGVWTRFVRLMLPLSKPALATSGVFSFLGGWDEYVWAVTIMNTPSRQTLPVAIALFSGAHTTNWGLTFAATTLAVIPSLIIFLIFQKQLVGGITAGALKS
jgi:multiple sugar transport system permease protein